MRSGGVLQTNADFQIFAPSDSPSKLRKLSNRQLCGPEYVDDIPRSVIHSISAD